VVKKSYLAGTGDAESQGGFSFSFFFNFVVAEVAIIHKDDLARFF